MSASTDARQGALAAVRRQARATPGVVAYVSLAALLGTVPGLAVPLLVRVFLDEYLTAGASEWVVPVLVGLVAAAICSGGLVWMQYRILVRLAVRLSAAGSTRYVWHALRIPSLEVQRFGTGDLTARATGLQRQAFQGGMLVPLAAVNVVGVVVYSGVLVVLDPWLGTAAIAVVIASAVLSRRLLRRRRPLQRAADADRLALAARTTDLVASIEVVKAGAVEQWVFDDWAQRRGRTGSSVSALSADGQRLGLVPSLTQAVGLGVVLALGAVLVVRGELSLGTLVASQALLMAVLVPAGQLVWIGALLEGVASTQRQADAVRAVALDPEVAPDRTVAPVPPPAGAAAGPVSLRLRGITFGYDRSAPPLLADFDLDVPAGSWVALVGGSGSGKSTIARLAVGELQPWSGSVELDGVARLDVPRDHRTSVLGYVPQYPVLVPGTILENLRLFDDTIDPAVVTRAMADACISEAVLARPRGLLEEIGPSGHGFSGGELQRLAIARALVRDPALLVLDEATSALDPVVEVEVVERLRRRGCTCLVVAHRLSTVRDADRIVVVTGGLVVQSGSFDEVSRTGPFAELAHG